MSKYTETRPEADGVILKTLDILALALTAHDHVWTGEERRLYDLSIFMLSEPEIPAPCLKCTHVRCFADCQEEV